VGTFTLGQLDLIGGSTITNEAMWTFNKQSLDQAAGILPGVTMQNTGGSRNERDLFVRGFDRLRVPLSIDGVRLYLPADNRLDFGRFLTPDLAEIQVQKGYVSVLNGPGGMGGAINMVSRKPTKAVEIEGRSGIVVDGDLESIGQWNGYAFAGTRQQSYYAQISGSIVDQDHFSLSDDFRPNLLVNEDGGDRDHSEFEDWRINAKLGYTPNANDEYTINFTSQAGEKSAPLHVDGQRVQGPRYWTWPQWDMESIAWLSKTQLGSASYIKTNAYYNTFDNVLSTFSNVNYSTQNTLGGQQGLIPFAFVSTYEDYAYGGFVEMGTNLIPMNTLKGAVHYRRDVHNEFDHIAPDGTTAGTNVIEPWSGNEEQTWSFALENTFHATPDFDLVLGGSYNRNVVDKATAVNSTTNTVFDNPTTEADAWDGQGAAIYRFSSTGTVHGDVSSRTRFPTTFDRYSTRFGSRPINPDLKPERATNYEIGWSDTLFRSARLSANVFYSDLEDSILNVFTAISGSGSIVGINADGEHYGFELSADWDIMPGLRIGGNYTYLERDIDFASAAASDPNLNAQQRAAVAAADTEGTPRHEAFIYLAWSPTAKLTLTPSLELASDRSSLVTSCRTTLLSTTPTPGCPGAVALPVPVPNYVNIGSYALLNFQAEYHVTENISAGIGATNLLDENYQLSHGFPEAGRQFFANVRAKF
jgi:iron complex outermembrane receptor protein